MRKVLLGLRSGGSAEHKDPPPPAHLPPSGTLQNPSQMLTLMKPRLIPSPPRILAVLFPTYTFH